MCLKILQISSLKWIFHSPMLYSVIIIVTSEDFVFHAFE